MKWMLGKLDFISAIAVAMAGAYFLPDDAFKDITTELIAFFSIQSAVILPAMIFTAGILKPDGLELEQAQKYHKALKEQMLFWVVLLALDFVAVVSLIVGKALGWELILAFPWRSDPVDLGWILSSILLFAGSLAIFRTVPFVRGVLSLLDLNSDMAQKAIKRRNRLERDDQKVRSDLRPMSLPLGYGAILDTGKTKDNSEPSED
jgi:hypothetical protein